MKQALMELVKLMLRHKNVQEHAWAEELSTENYVRNQLAICAPLLIELLIDLRKGVPQ